MNENEIKVYSNMGFSKSSVKRDITYIKKELSQINNLTVHIKKLEKERRNET